MKFKSLYDCPYFYILPLGGYISDGENLFCTATCKKCETTKCELTEQEAERMYKEHSEKD